MVREGTSRRRKTSDTPTTPSRRKRPGPTVTLEAAFLASTVFHQEIAARAYELFLARGGQHGDDWADWFRAEAEVLGKMNRGTSPAGK
jgi:hypothetical protein